MRWQARDPLVGLRMGMLVSDYSLLGVTARADDGGEANATFLPFSSTPRKVQLGQLQRVRFAIQETGGATDDAFYRLRFSVDGKESITSVTTTSNVRIGSSSFGGDYVPTTSQLGVGSGTFESGYWYNRAGESMGGYWGPFSIPANGYTEQEVTFTPIGSGLEIGDIVRMHLSYGRADNSLVYGADLVTSDMEISPPPVESGSGRVVVVLTGSGPYRPPEGPADGSGAQVAVSAAGGGVQTPWSHEKFIFIPDFAIVEEGLGVTEPSSRFGDIQTFEVPATGTYYLEAVGAQGGYSGHGINEGGLGAKVAGEFELTEGQTLNILVGAHMTVTPSISTRSGGGGGATAIWIDGEPTPLLVAGGGGAAGNRTATVAHANITENGNAGYDTGGGDNGWSSPGDGGIDGGGGGGGVGDGAAYAGGGAGWLSDGGNGDGSNSNGGIRPLAGGLGGDDDFDGGFGGGGGGRLGGGGGGGYSGGGAGGFNNITNGGGEGGGGGSFNAGLNQVNETQVGAGQGVAIIQATIGDPNPPMNGYNDLDVVEPTWYRYRIRRFVAPEAPSAWTPFIQRQAFGIAREGGAGTSVAASAGGAGSPTKFSYPSTPGYRAPYPYRNALIYRAPQDEVSARVTVQAVAERSSRGVTVLVTTGTGYLLPPKGSGAGALVQVIAAGSSGGLPPEERSGGAGATVSAEEGGAGVKGGRNGSFATIVVATVITLEFEAEAVGFVSSGVAGDGEYVVQDDRMGGKSVRRRPTFR